MPTFFMKIIKQPGERLVAACDKEVVDMELDGHGVKIKVNQIFYGEELVNEKELLDAIKNCTSANIIGTRSIDVLIENRMIHKDAILWMEQPGGKGKKIGHAILIR